jgi:dTDP-4-amino-4,6-dideoxygalactose transaminase
MTDLQAALGRVQLERLPEIIARRRELARRYDAALASVPGIVVPEEPVWASSNWQSYCVGLPTGANQREVMQTMLDHGIATRRGVMNIHLEDAYQRCRSYVTGSDLDRSVAAQQHSIILPLSVQMPDEDIDLVVDTLHLALQQAAMAA